MIHIGFGSIGLDLGLLLLLVSAIAFILDAIFVLIGERFNDWEIFSEYSFIVACSTSLISFFYFSLSIVNADYNFVYVSSLVNNQMDFFMRLSVIWSGQAGSYFFWTFLAVLTYIVFRSLFRNYAHEPMFWRSFLLISINIIVLTVLTVFSEPFELNTVPMTNGVGLNPLLMNMWNFIHPPIIFIGYVLCLLPMVIAIVRISLFEKGKVVNFEGKDKLDNLFEFSVSLAWLVLTSGIIIGGYWAFITLGWGGFWAWDPIETASLVPWLFLTLYYHGKSFQRKSEFLGNYVISMTYIGALFATYLTRSGVVSSVHAFSAEGRLEQLLSIIIPKNSFIMAIILRFIPNETNLILFTFTAILFSIPIVLGIKNRELMRLPIKLSKSDFQRSKSRSTALKVSYITFLVGTYVMILGLLTPIIYDIIGYIIKFSPDGFDNALTIDQSYYNTILTFFGLILLITQFFCTFFPRVSFRRKVQLLAGGISAGIIFSIGGIFYRSGDLTRIFGQGNPILSFLNDFWTTSDKANLVIPLVLLGLIGLIIEFVNISLKEEKNIVRKTSQVMLHISILMIILGAILSSNMTITHEMQVQEGGIYDIPGSSIRIEIMDMKKTIPESGQHSVEYDTIILILSGSKPIKFSVSRLSYDLVNRQDPEVTIINQFLHSIYIVTTQTYENVFTGAFSASDLQIRIIPFINILWIGCILIHFAILPLTIGRFAVLRSSLQKMEQFHEEKATTHSSEIVES
jgi:cytochrome c biogenesis factor